MRYGFIGLGNLGGHLAANLIAKGFDVVVCDQDKARGERYLKAGAIWADTPQNIAALCDTVITCLPSPQVSEAVLRELLAAGFSGSWGVPLDLATRTRDAFIRGRDAYGGRAQSTMIVKLLEDALNTDLRAPGFPARL